MKIAVIFTGGTIGSRESGGEISPNRDTKYSLLENFEKSNGKVCDFTCFEPYFALSENLNAKTLNLLILEVKKALEGDFDGIIVTHGTDTLQFSAAAVSFAVNTEIPLVFVSSNYPLNNPKANGNDNFKSAVDFILEGNGGGVYISYKNCGDEAKILPANRVYTFLEDDDRIFEAKASVSCPVFDFKLIDKPNILVIDPHPCDGYSYNLEGVRAVVLRPYHSGTLPTDESSLEDFCNRAKKLNIPLFLCGGAEGATYQSSSKYGELGIIPLPHSPFAATYIKLWIGISLEKELNEFMKK